MQAVIMAAGKGNRLGELTRDIPKAFLEIEGCKLIEINIALLHSRGIRDIVIVTGYRNECFEALLKEQEGIRFVYNPFYEMVNVLGSFFMARDAVSDDFIYMHADTLCSPSIFDRMIETEADMVLPIDYKRCDGEAMKIVTKAGRLIQISKDIPLERGEGEFIGIMKIKREVLDDLRKVTKRLMKEKNFSSYFEGALQELLVLNRYHVALTPTGGEFWGEIDFSEDLERVKENISQELIDIAKREWKK